MNAVRTSLITTAVLGAVTFAMPTLAQVAQIQAGLNTAAGGSYGTSASADQLPYMIGTVIGIVLQTVGVLLLGYLVYAGFLWMTAGGDEKKVHDATTTIRNVIIGLIIIVMANAIASFVLYRLNRISSGGTGEPVTENDYSTGGGVNPWETRQ